MPFSLHAVFWKCPPVHAAIGWNTGSVSKTTRGGTSVRRDVGHNYSLFRAHRCTDRLEPKLTWTRNVVAIHHLVPCFFPTLQVAPAILARKMSS